MCLRAPLPIHYLSNDGNRMALAYFIINAIAILTPPDSQSTPLIPPQDRRKLRQWVLSHQQPGGGFTSTSTLVFPIEGHEQWEAETGAEDREGAGLANLPATLFALQLLALLADEDDEAGAFEGVDRVQTLRWLRRLQRDDGSFGEVLKRLPGHGWFIGGGYDMRYCYIAASTRWMLRGGVKEGEPGWVEDFDTEGLARYILSSQVCCPWLLPLSWHVLTSQTYDGGFAGSSQEEPHGMSPLPHPPRHPHIANHCSRLRLLRNQRPLLTRPPPHKQHRRPP
jgi:geranylgeranyl transferase type-1 subunit beta